MFSGAVVPVCSVDCVRVRVRVCTLNAPWQLLAYYPLKGKQALCDLPLSIADMPLSGHGFFSKHLYCREFKAFTTVH